jgi:hypothetical protein
VENKKSAGGQEAILNGNISAFATDHVRPLIMEDLKRNPAKKNAIDSNADLIATSIKGILTAPGEATNAYLRALGDAYTLLAFLRHTPDVQNVVRKIFSHGEVWLDTSAILPLLAEELLEEGEGQFQKMFALARQAGMSFLVTSGVVEEIERHLNRALLCHQMVRGRWQGNFPFLYEAFLQSGRDPSDFKSAIETFRGEMRPLDDLFEFLSDRFGIERRDLEDKYSEAPQEMRHAVQEIWYKIHQKRREETGRVADPIVIKRLSMHDAENYLGVVQQRKQEKPSALGYSAWWLTLDRTALSVAKQLRRQFSLEPPDSPILSIDFLALYLTLGPMRSRVSKDSLRNLPVVLEPRLVRFLTPELLDEAAKVRSGLSTMPERLVRRQVRDFLDQKRKTEGRYAKRGMEAVFDELAATP